MPKYEIDVEEALTIVWKQIENKNDGAANIAEKLEKYIGGNIFDRLVEKNLVRKEGGGEKVAFTEEGYRCAYDLTRRHRLAERLLVDVMGMDRSNVDPDACQMEHVISRGLEEQICTLLGHPKVCPHGSPIHPGECCRKKASQIERAIFGLDELKHGESGVLCYIQGDGQKLFQKLMSLGMVPGVRIRVHQTWPAYVIEFDNTQLAIEIETAAKIFIRKEKAAADGALL